jgi:hypothetical protein
MLNNVTSVTPCQKKGGKARQHIGQIDPEVKQHLYPYCDDNQGIIMIPW